MDLRSYRKRNGPESAVGGGGGETQTVTRGAGPGTTVFVPCQGQCLHGGVLPARRPSPSWPPERCEGGPLSADAGPPWLRPLLYILSVELALAMILQFRAKPEAEVGPQSRKPCRC